MPPGTYPTRDATPSRSPAFPLLRLLGLLVCLFLAACQTLPRFTVEPLPRYEALFQNPSGWSGGDGAYSAALGSDRFLWLFGDTLLGEVKDGRRIMAGLVANSIAVQTGREPRAASVDFFPDGGSAPFLTPAEGPGWFWPYHALRTPGAACIFFSCALSAPTFPRPLVSGLYPTGWGMSGTRKTRPKAGPFPSARSPGETPNGNSDPSF